MVYIRLSGLSELFVSISKLSEVSKNRLLGVLGTNNNLYYQSYIFYKLIYLLLQTPLYHTISFLFCDKCFYHIFCKTVFLLSYKSKYVDKYL